MSFLSQPFPPVCPTPALLERDIIYTLPGQTNVWLLCLREADQGALSYGGLNGTVYPVIRQHQALFVQLYEEPWLLMAADGDLKTEVLEGLRTQEPEFKPFEVRFQTDSQELDPPNECAWVLPSAERPFVAVLKTQTLYPEDSEDAVYEVMLNLPGSRKVRGMMRDFPLYDHGEEALGRALWVRLANGSPALLFNGHTGFFDCQVYLELLYNTPPLAVPTGKRKTVQADEALAPAEELPPLLFLTQLVSKYAKVPPKGIDRLSLYRLKDALMQALYTQGLIVPDVVLTSAWPLASDLQGWGVVLADLLANAYAFADEQGTEHPWGPQPPAAEEAQAWLNALVQQAEFSGEALTPRAFLERGVGVLDVPINVRRSQTEWRDLQPYQLEQLHPRSRWLIGFGTPDDPSIELLHLPYLRAQLWLKDLPPRRAVRQAEPYGAPPTPAQLKTWSLERVLRQLGYDFGQEIVP